MRHPRSYTTSKHAIKPLCSFMQLGGYQTHKDVPAACSLLAPDALAELDGQEPPAVPYVLTEGGTPVTTHVADGLVL